MPCWKCSGLHELLVAYTEEMANYYNLLDVLLTHYDVCQTDFLPILRHIKEDSKLPLDWKFLKYRPQKENYGNKVNYCDNEHFAEL